MVFPPISRRRFLSGSTEAVVGRALASVLPWQSDTEPNVPTPQALETPYKYGKRVLSASGDAGAFDSKSVDVPFVFQHDGSFYMSYVGWDGIGYQTGLASSEDMVSWTKLGVILRRDPKSEVTRYNVAMTWILRDNDVRSPGQLKKINGRFLGAYHAYPNPGYEAGPALIGLCWSNDLFHWTLDPPCLRPEDGAEWENGGLYKACLVKDRGTYYLIYNAKTKPLPQEGWREQTGVASSRDLRTWTRYPGNPIIRNGGRGSWDDRFASDPCAVRYNDSWAIFYYGLSSKGQARDLLAVGKDLFHPVKTDSVIIDVGPPGSVDETFAHKPAVVTHKGGLYHYYCAVSGKWPNEVRGISVARSRPWP